MNDARYLRITMHDNDYTRYIQYVAESLQNIFEYDFICFEDGIYSLSEDDFPELKELIKQMLCATYNVIHKIQSTNEKRDYKKEQEENFGCHLELVDYLDIPENDNWESVYIPLFDGEIIVR